MRPLAFQAVSRTGKHFPLALTLHEVYTWLLAPQNLTSSSLKLRADFYASLRGGFARNCDDNGSKSQK